MSGVARIAEKAVTALVGPIGAALVAGSASSSRPSAATSPAIIAASRSCFAMAADGRFFPPAARVHPVYRTPHVALLITSAWSAFLTLTGGYQALFTYVTFASVLFGTLGGIAIFVLRARRPDVPRPYRALGYPLIPALYVLGSFALVWNTLMERPTESISGLGLVALGLPFYLLLVAPRPAEADGRRSARPAASGARGASSDASSVSQRLIRSCHRRSRHAVRTCHALAGRLIARLHIGGRHGVTDSSVASVRHAAPGFAMASIVLRPRRCCAVALAARWLRRVTPRAQSVDTIVTWNRVLLTAVATPGPNRRPSSSPGRWPSSAPRCSTPPTASTASYQPAFAWVDVPAGASRDAAVAQAAHDALVGGHAVADGGLRRGAGHVAGRHPGAGGRRRRRGRRRRGQGMHRRGGPATAGSSPFPPLELPSLPGYWKPTPPNNSDGDLHQLPGRRGLHRRERPPLPARGAAGAHQRALCHRLQPGEGLGRGQQHRPLGRADADLQPLGRRRHHDSQPERVEQRCSATWRAAGAGAASTWPAATRC